MSSLLALIPARGGSKGISRKNLRTLQGKPLVAHAILAARACPLIHRTVVTTEDKEIAEVSQAYGAEVIPRPWELATDTARIEDVILHAIGECEKAFGPYEHFILLQPTSPLRTAELLCQAIQLYLDEKAASLVSVCEISHHPLKSLRVEGKHVRPFFPDAPLTQNRQALPPAFRANGAIYLTQTHSFKKTRDFFLPPTLAFPMPQRLSIDIDTLDDLTLCETLAQGKPRA